MIDWIRRLLQIITHYNWQYILILYFKLQLQILIFWFCLIQCVPISFLSLSLLLAYSFPFGNHIWSMFSAKSQKPITQSIRGGYAYQSDYFTCNNYIKCLWWIYIYLFILLIHSASVFISNTSLITRLFYSFAQHTPWTADSETKRLPLQTLYQVPPLHGVNHPPDVLCIMHYNLPQLLVLILALVHAHISALKVYWITVRDKNVPEGYKA